jgi:hypothetical protein
MKTEKVEAILAHLKKIDLLPRRSLLTGGRFRRFISLYGWSEPVLNPEINEILKVCRKHDFVCGVSSNFISPWKIDPENYSCLGCIHFSICSFKKERYKKYTELIYRQH